MCLKHSDTVKLSSASMKCWEFMGLVAIADFQICGFHTGAVSQRGDGTVSGVEASFHRLRNVYIEDSRKCYIYEILTLGRVIIHQHV